MAGDYLDIFLWIVDLSIFGFIYLTQIRFWLEIDQSIYLFETAAMIGKKKRL